MNVREVLRAIRDQKRYVLVVGLGISGIETIKFLSRIGIQIRAVEREDKDNYLNKSKFSEQVSKMLSQGAEIHFGIDGERVQPLLSGVSLCIVSPGVSLESSIVGTLKRNAIAVMSELELGIELLAIPSIVVTGSNGKSTTVSLIHYILRRSGYHSMLCGNVGVPVVAGVPPNVLDNYSLDEKAVLVVEASSYQLESCSVLRPKVAVLLNISENHLERHGTLDRYLSIKARIFANQTGEDFAVLCLDDSKITAIAPKLNSNYCGFGSDRAIKSSLYAGAYISYDSDLKVDKITFNTNEISESYDISGSKLRGLHNRLNIAAAITATRLFGASLKSIVESINDFSPLEHRLETCSVVREVTYVNDSKSTTVAATEAALKTILLESGINKIVLMIGGLSKAGSWDPLMQELDKHRDRLRTIICFGKDRHLLGSKCAHSNLPFEESPTLEEGVRSAYQKSHPGDLVLLSPGCASFDQFTDFENRGSVFKSVVAALDRNKAA